MKDNFRRSLDPEFGHQERFLEEVPSELRSEELVGVGHTNWWGEEENIGAEVWRSTCPDHRIQNRSLWLQVQESGDDSGKRWSYGAFHRRRTNEHTGLQSRETERMRMWDEDTSSSRSSLDLFISATIHMVFVTKKKKGNCLIRNIIKCLSENPMYVCLA